MSDDRFCAGYLTGLTGSVIIVSIANYINVHTKYNSVGVILMGCLVGSIVYTIGDYISNELDDEEAVNP